MSESNVSEGAKRVIQLVLAIILVMLFAHWVASAAEAAEISKKDLNVQIDQTNFAVGNPTFCSATLIDAQKGYLLTANHCIRQMFEVVEREKISDDGVVKKEKVRVAKPGLVSQLVFKDGDVVVRTDYVFKIVLNDADMDLALVQVKGQLPMTIQAPAALACQPVERGDTVYAVGNSYGVLYASLTKGIVSSTDRGTALLDLDQFTPSKFVQFSAPIVGGNSGGALYNEAGEFVGVNVRGGATGFGLAVPLDEVKKFLRRHFGEKLWERCDKK